MYVFFKDLIYLDSTRGWGAETGWESTLGRLPAECGARPLAWLHLRTTETAEASCLMDSRDESRGQNGEVKWKLIKWRWEQKGRERSSLKSDRGPERVATEGFYGGSFLENWPGNLVNILSVTFKTKKVDL